ncbi:hypothetical protein MRX96_015033 [Rhipicephalus microplus]
MLAGQPPVTFNSRYRFQTSVPLGVALPVSHCHATGDASRSQPRHRHAPPFKKQKTYRPGAERDNPRIGSRAGGIRYVERGATLAQLPPTAQQQAPSKPRLPISLSSLLSFYGRLPAS